MQPQVISFIICNGKEVKIVCQEEPLTEPFFSPRARWWSPSQCPSPSSCLCQPLTPGVTREEEEDCPPPRPLLSTVSMTTEPSGERSADTGRGEREVAAERDTGEGGHVRDQGPGTGAPGGGGRGAGAGAGGGTRTGTSGSARSGSTVPGGGGQTPRGARRTGGWPPAVTPS